MATRVFMFNDINGFDDKCSGCAFGATKRTETGRMKVCNESWCRRFGIDCAAARARGGKCGPAPMFWRSRAHLVDAWRNPTTGEITRGYGDIHRTNLYLSEFIRRGDKPENAGLKGWTVIVGVRWNRK